MDSENIFMIKEIKETPIALARTIEKESQSIDDVTDNLIREDIGALYFVGSGGSYYLNLADEKFKDLATVTKNVIFLPSLDEYLSPLIYSTPLEFLAYYRAVLKGYNPDKPRRHPGVVRVE